MVSEICSNLLVSVCNLFETNGNQPDFAEKALSLFVEKLQRKSGHMFGYEDNHAYLIVSVPDNDIDLNRNAIISSLIKSTFSEPKSAPTRIVVGDESYNILTIPNYGFMFLGADNLIDDETIACLKPVSDHLGSLLKTISNHSGQYLKNLVYRNLAFVASKTTDIIIITDCQGLITYVNNSYTQRTGFTLEESLGKRPSELLHGPETDKDTKKRMLTAILGGKSIKAEVLNYTKQKEEFWLQITIDPVFDEEGECIAYVSVSRDISYKKAVDRELLHKENMLHSIVTCSNEFLVNTDVFDAIAKSLPVIGKAVDVDRVYFFRNRVNEGNKLVTSQVSEWNSGIAQPQIDNPEMQDLPIEIIDIFLEDLYQRKYVSAVVSLMPEGLPYRKILESQDVKSLIIFPIFIDNFFWGIAGFDECNYERIWAEDEISILQNFCITVANAVERAKVTDELMNLYLLPKESPFPVVRTDLDGHVMISNQSAENITYFKYNQGIFSFADFFRMIAKEVDTNNPQKGYEVTFEDKIYQVTSVLSSNRIHINNYLNDITDLKKSKFDLERLSLVAMNTRQGVQFTDMDIRLTYANEALLKMTGYTLEEVIGKTPMELFHGPLTQTDEYVKLNDTHHSLEPSEVDLITYRKDKSWFWANVKKQPLTSRDQNGPEFFSIIEDITEKKMVEEHLRNSETRISELIKNLKEGILLEDEQRKIVLTNDHFCKLFGIEGKPCELIGEDCEVSARKVATFMKNPEEFLDRIRVIIADKKPALKEELELTDGSVFERDYLPILIDNEVKGHLWKYSDISEQKSRERSLSHNEEKYRNIITNMKMSLVETDIDDTVTYVNQEFCDMTGYSRSEIIGRKSTDTLVAEDFIETVKSKYSIRKEGTSDIYQFQVRLKNGDRRWWLTSGGPNFNDNGELIGTIGISVDITEQKRLENELEISRRKAEESSYAKEAFLASMSHEIRTPLNVIIGMIRELAREKLSEKQQIYLRNAQMASHHLLTIVNDVLDITKIASGQINLDLGAFNLTELINEIIQMLTPESREKMLGLSASISQMIAPIYIGDANRIKQILINIVSNSIKFTDTGGISVECTLQSKNRSSHQIRMKISDTGIGMEESFLDHIFDKFSQGDYSSARKAGGTGLGMAITYELVKMMKGTITVSSRKGFGTTTEITLDLEVGSVEEIRTSIESESFDDLRNRKILLVEDSDLNRMVALNSLNYYGLEVSEATNGYEAIEKVNESSFDLILMDLQMPVMGGLEATRIIREELKLKIPIIALTAHAFKAEIDRCMEAGMNDYIIKPFDETALMTVLVKHIKDIPGMPPKKQEQEIVKANGVKLYNLDAIIKMSRGNRDFIKRIIQVFIEQTPSAVDEIKLAWQNKDLDTIRSVAHKIKPNLDNFGIADLKQDIRTIESMAEEKNASAELEEKINKLERIVKAVVNDLAYEVF